jgi:hypothetical protein
MTPSALCMTGWLPQAHVLKKAKQKSSVCDLCMHAEEDREYLNKKHRNTLLPVIGGLATAEAAALGGPLRDHRLEKEFGDVPEFQNLPQSLAQDDLSHNLSCVQLLGLPSPLCDYSISERQEKG